MYCFASPSRGMCKPLQHASCTYTPRFEAKSLDLRRKALLTGYPLASLPKQSYRPSLQQTTFHPSKRRQVQPCRASLISCIQNVHPLAWVGVLLLAFVAKKAFDTPSRTYDPNDPNVGREYDAWTDEGLVEYYWGDHIHLGYYTEADRRAGYKKKNFKAAKLEFVDEMLRFSAAKAPKRILDVGCGIGGSSRHLAAKFPDAEVVGITLSPKQQERATQLAKERGLANCSFRVMDALNMDLPEGHFDLVWACESGEHMPDKRRYVEQMMRVLAPGGRIAIATWCQRETTPSTPLTDKEKADLQFLYDEWAHPFFVSKEEYGRMLQGTGAAEAVHLEDWTPETLPSWRHSNWVGVWDPWIVIFKGPRVWYSVLREIVMLERMHRAFSRGLMQYGMITAGKPASSKQTSSQHAMAGSSA